MTQLRECGVSSPDHRLATVSHAPERFGRLCRGGRLTVFVIGVVLAILALQSRLTGPTAAETAIMGVWRADPWEGGGGQYTQMSLQSGHRVDVAKYAADGKVIERYRGTWSLRQEKLVVDTRSLWGLLLGVCRIATQGDIWEFSVRNGKIIQGPDAPKPVVLHRVEQE